MVRPTGSTTRSVVRWEDDQSRSIDDQLAVEEPLEIRLANEPLAVTMRTPGHDVDLAAGFCLTENIVVAADEIEAIRPCTEAKFDNIVIVELSDDALSRRSAQVSRARRELYLSSSCGLCGKQSIDRIHQELPHPIGGRFKVKRSDIERWPSRMRDAQRTFDQTGGLHAAGLFSANGDVLVFREDVGRHNAVDKVIGHQLMLGQVPLESAGLLVSGRASFEIMQKAAMAGIGLVAAISAPSSLAVDFAKECGQTLIGFLRSGRMNIYNDNRQNPRVL